MTYKEQLAHPKWQKKRLEILQKDKYTCQICLDTETQLQVHHKYYDKTFKTMAWEYPSHAYQTLCIDCHDALTEHIKLHGGVTDFNALRIKNESVGDFYFIYANGSLRFDTKNFKTYVLSDDMTYKVVQFLINNWLKNA